jgi:hypothetical protein
LVTAGVEACCKRGCLTKRSYAGFAAVALEFRQLLPSQQGFRWDADGLGGFFVVPGGEQGGDGLFQLGSQFRPVAGNLRTPESIWGLFAIIASPSPQSESFCQKCLFSSYLGVIDVVTARARNERKAIMKSFTIDEQNNITAWFQGRSHGDHGIGFQHPEGTGEAHGGVAGKPLHRNLEWLRGRVPGIIGLVLGTADSSGREHGRAVPKE